MAMKRTKKSLYEKNILAYDFQNLQFTRYHIMPTWDIQAVHTLTFVEKLRFRVQLATWCKNKYLKWVSYITVRLNSLQTYITHCGLA